MKPSSFFKLNHFVIKISILSITVIMSFSNINGQNKQDSSQNTNQKLYNEIGRHTITVGFHNRIIDYKKLKGGNYILRLRSSMQKNGTDIYNLIITPEGDSVNATRVVNFKEVFNNEEIDNNYYLIASDTELKEGFSTDYLACFDKNWELKLANHYHNLKDYDALTIMTITSDKKILVISNEYLKKSETPCLAFRLFDLRCKLISNKFVPKNGANNPISIIKSSDNNFFLTVEEYDMKTNIHNLSLMKINQKGDIIWTRKYPDFYPHQTILSRKGDLVTFGSYFSRKVSERIQGDYIKVVAFDTSGNYKWQKVLKKYFDEDPGNIIETKNGNYLFSCGIKKAFNHETLPYLFELNKNGEITFERLFDYHLGISSIPFLIQASGQITMIGQKWSGKFGHPFEGVVQVIKLAE